MNFKQFKAGQPAANRYSIWQYMVIVVTICIMGLSALPNLYHSQESVELTPFNPDLPVTNTHSLHQLLSKQGFEVKSINSAENSSVVSIQSTQSILELQRFLAREFNNSHRAVITQQDTTPQWLKALGGAPIKLGLDLSGGVLFVLDVDIKHASSEKNQQLLQAVKTLLREQNIRNVKTTLSELKGNQDNKQSAVVLDYKPTANLSSLAKTIKSQFPQLTLESSAKGRLTLFYSPLAQQQFAKEVMQQTLTTMRARIEELGITEAVVQQQGIDKIRIELPGANNPDEARPIIGATASLDFYELQTNRGKTFTTEDGQKVRVNPTPIFTGDHIRHAQSGLDEMGKPLVNLALDSEGGGKMHRFSAQNIGQPMVTVYSEYYQNTQGETVKNSKIINIATINDVLGSRFSITNLSSSQTATDLALLLRAGSLIAPVTIAKERTISATLGETNINNGISALILGVGLTLLFMALWYRRLGLIANCALFLNLICLVGLMSLLPGVVLTLPGIAGLVLTVGMAVDTNVLIFERIKEERKRGRSIPLAVDAGYRNALGTILDANITTFLTALVLYSVGYGPIKGFSITLGLGILTSMFTGIFIARALTNLFYANTETCANQQGAQS